MFFFKQFENFNPISDYVPAYPFAPLPEIASRARKILIGLTLEQIVIVAEKISYEVERYFEDERDKGIYDLERRLEEEGNQEEFELYFEWDGGSRANGRWIFKEEMLEQLEIPTADNCSEVDALKSIIEARGEYFFLPEGAVEPVPEDFLDRKNYQLFAVLSLWLLADAIKWSRPDSKPHSDSIASEFAIKAMDAVCQAEHLREVEWLTDAFQRAITISKENQEKIRESLQVGFEMHEKEKQSERAKQLNVARHARTNMAKEVVIKEWEKSKASYPSAEKAGLYFADWLISEGHVKKIEPRTVTTWIREHAKRIGVKFR